MGGPHMLHNCRMMRTRVALALVAVLAVPSSALDNGLARTPPMGYNTWNAFGCNITEALVQQQMDLMVDLGLVDMGYRFFNLDDCWSSLWRDSHGRLQADPDRFPSGIPHLVEYARKRGMVLGLYGDAGALTCAGRPGSQGHEEEDAALLASWGVGYFKYDNCWADVLHPIPRYVKMRDQLLKHSKAQPVVFSICEWGTAQPHLWAPKVGNLWRTSSDIRASTSSWRANLDATVGLSMYAGPGAWNDPDMLEIGHPKTLRPQEEAAHFALWALLKAPLLIGCDLSRLPPLARELLRSRLLVAANQDALGIAGDLVRKQGMMEIFAAPLQGGRRAVVLHSRNMLLPIVDVTLPWSLVGYDEACKLHITDMFSESLLGRFSGQYRTHVQPGAAVALLLEPVHGHCSPSQGADDSWRPWHSGFFGSKQQGPPVPPPPSGTAELVQEAVLPQEQAV